MFLRAFTAVVWLTAAATAQTQGTRPPVIDIHVHTFGGVPGVGPMCPFNPQFLAADPHTKADPFGWAKQDCTEQLEPSKNPDEYMKAVLAEYERLNVTAVVMGDQKSVQKWKDAAPERIIAGTSFETGSGGGKYLPVEDLRTAFTKGGFQVMGEVGLAVSGPLAERSLGGRVFCPR